MTECNQVSFPFYVKKNLTVDFKGGEISSDAGLLLIRQLDEKLGFTKGLANCLDDRRHKSYVKQPLVDILRQRLYQIMAGYEDANDADTLRDDPVLKSLAGRLLSDEPLASQPTISRFENTVTTRELYRFSKSLLDCYISSKGCSRTRIIMDVDATDDAVHGHQQLSFFHGYYDNYIYHPLLIYDGETGELLTAVLRPGNVHASRQMVAVLKRVIRRLREAFGEVKIVLRAGGVAAPASAVRYGDLTALGKQYCVI